MAPVDVSGWSLMAVTVGKTRRCCCVDRASSASGEGAGRSSAGAGLSSGSCTVAVGCEAGVAVLAGRLKTSVAVGGDGIVAVGGGVVWRRGCSGWRGCSSCLTGGSCWTIEVEDFADWRRFAGSGLAVFADRRFLGFFGAEVAKSQVIVTASYVG